MNKFLILVLSLLFAAPMVYADPFSGYNYQDSQRCTSGEFRNAQAVGDTNTVISFSADTKAIYVENIGGTNEMYFDPRDGVAAATSTGGILLRPGEKRSLGSFETRSLGVIASSGESTTAYVEVCY